MTTASATPSGGALTRLFADLDWRSVDPTNPTSPQMAALWGDPASGPYGAILRVPAGFESPIHHHSRDERVVMTSGTSLHWTADGSRDEAPAMTAGDSMVMPAGIDHVSAAAPGEDCLEFITQDGPFDFALGTAAADGR